MLIYYICPGVKQQEEQQKNQYCLYISSDLRIRKLGRCADQGRNTRGGITASIHHKRNILIGYMWKIST